jgi:cytochrome P450
MYLFIISLLGVLALHAGSQKWSKRAEANKYAKIHGCMEPPKEDPWDYFGIQKMISSVRALVNGRALENATIAFERYGETFGAKILAQRVYFTCSPKNIKHVLVSRFVDFEASSVRAHLFRPITEHGIFAVDGEQWKKARDMYRGLFSNTRAIVNFPKLEERFQNLVKHIPATEKFDLQKLCLKLTLDMVSEFALGESLDTLNPEAQSQEKKDLTQSILNVDRIMARDGFLGPVAAFTPKKEFYNSCVTIHRFVEKKIYVALEKRRNNNAKPKEEQVPVAFNVLEGLMVNTQDMLELRDSATSIIIAGIEAMTSLIGTTFFLLSRHERVQEKLRDIILATIGHEAPTFDQLQNLAYLRYVLNESK